MSRVLVGVSGGIAAFKACELVRLLVRSGHEVVPLVTAGAERFVRRRTFEALAGRPWSDEPFPHLARAELLVIAPLTANTLAKLANGLADGVLTEAALAHQGPLLVAPAMNPRMWAHPATTANAAVLRARGVEFVGPDEGETAEGELGVGRMAEPERIFARCRELLGEDDALLGRRVLVSAGGTREPLDSVRYLGNRSSGRMGVALAEAARRRGADVTLLAANLAVPAPVGVNVIETPTAADLLREALGSTDVDVVLMAAAVADYRPLDAHPDKRPKSGRPWHVELEPTEDVLAALAARRENGQVLVGFAADHGEQGLARAREKLVAKHIDLVVFNDISRPDIGFDSADNEVTLVSRGAERTLGKAPKELIASAIVDEAVRVLENGGRGRR